MANDDKLYLTKPDKPRKTTPPKGTPPTTTKNTKDGGGGGVSSAEKRALAREKEAKKKAADKYLRQAGNLTAQANAIRNALRKQFKKARDQNLVDIDLMLTQQLGLLKEGAGLRGAEFLTAASDTEKATAGAQEGSFRNLVRERADSMTAILEQGAGETDAVRAMLMAARNWSANAGEANRAYFDTMQSINQGITDLNIDTKAALANAFSTAEGQREQIWQDFYNRRAESFTQLGNTLGQKADLLLSAKEMDAKVSKKRIKSVEKNMDKAWEDAAKESGKSYKQQALPAWITDWRGTEQVERRQENTNLAAAPTFEQTKKAQGATLRKWAA